jgi:neurofibromin 1
MSDQKIVGNHDTQEELDEMLDDIGFGGLWRSSSFLAYNDQDRKCAMLTGRLIEVCIHSRPWFW